MKETIIKIAIKKDSDQMFYPVPFEVPEGIERLEFIYTYSPKKPDGALWNNEVGFILVNEKGEDVGNQGAQGVPVDISASYSTPRYDLSAPNPGRWTVYISGHRILSDVVNVELRIKMIPKKGRWLKGDVHCHSYYSDGKQSYDWLLNKSIKNGLDFLIMTDHNRTVVGDLPRRDGFTMINGIEMTYSKGHANVWGLKQPYTGTFAVNTFEEWLERKKEAENNGARVCINHPLCTKCPWLWPLEGFDYDIVEVWNGPMRPDNQRCIEWWHNKLCEGRKIKAVGGSDYHNDYVVTNLLGNPTTCVYADSASPEDILRGIDAGHVTITENAKRGTVITMTSGDAMVGDTISYKEGATVKVKVKRFKKGQTLFVRDQEGILYEYTAKKSGDYEVEVPVRGKGFVRAETKQTYHGFKKLLINVVLYFMIREQAFKPHPDYCTALCNPIYFD